MYCDHDALVHLQRSIRLPLFTRSSYLFFQQVLNNCRLNSVDCCDFYFFLTFDLHQRRMHDWALDRRSHYESSGSGMCLYWRVTIVNYKHNNVLIPSITPQLWRHGTTVVDQTCTWHSLVRIECIRKTTWCWRRIKRNIKWLWWIWERHLWMCNMRSRRPRVPVLSTEHVMSKRRTHGRLSNHTKHTLVIDSVQ